MYPSFNCQRICCGSFVFFYFFTYVCHYVADWDTDEKPDQYTHSHKNTDPYSLAYRQEICHKDAHSDPHKISNHHTITDPHPHCSPDSNRYAYVHRDTHDHEHTHLVVNGDTYSGFGSACVRYSGTYTGPAGNAHTDVDCGTHFHRNGNGYSDRNANTYAHCYQYHYCH